MKKGFTLIELIVVIAIIAILAAIIAPNAFRAIDKAKIARACRDIKTIAAACKIYYSDIGKWPLNDQLGTEQQQPIRNSDLLKNVYTLAGWDGPYLENEPPTPWGSTYWITATNIADNFAPYDSTVVLTSNAYTNFADHIAPMPSYILQKMDEILDDGNLTTGRFVNTSIYGPDEGVFVYHWGGE